jgi:hypothetical protein
MRIFTINYRQKNSRPEPSFKGDIQQIQIELVWGMLLLVSWFADKRVITQWESKLPGVFVIMYKVWLMAGTLVFFREILRTKRKGKRRDSKFNL